ncbi:MAG: MFS transporter [Gammaproteobacteria bacterium]|nr:MFS transporter [Gammaproteobacteria bacterium]
MPANEKRNLAILFFSQGILGAQIPVNFILGGLAGALLAENRAFATLPISIVVLVAMFVAPVASLFMGRFGRRAGFLLGAASGAIGGALAVQALFAGRFDLLLLGAAFTGVFQAFQQFFRFAAADAASEEFKPKAISLVLGAGLINAILAGEVVRLLGGALDPIPYAGAYAGVIGLNFIGACVVMFLRIPRPPRQAESGGEARPLGVIFRQPRVITAVLCAMVSYAVMNLVMTSTPLSLVGHGFTTNQAADVVRWHVVAMFAPSFVTGHIIARVGHLPVIGTGLLLLGVCSAIALSGVDLHHFYLALVALGVGWNFGFVGATSLLATAHAPEEQAKVQGLNDFLVFGLVAFASFSSGALLNAFGWSAVQLAVLPSVLVALAIIAWYRLVLLQRRTADTPA